MADSPARWPDWPVGDDTATWCRDGGRALPPVVNVHRDDPTNLGDLAAAVARWYPQLATARLDLQFTPWERLPGTFHQRTVILGGGGIVEFRQPVALLQAARPGRLVVWGAGHNDHGAATVTPAGWLRDADLVGIRDHGITLDGRALRWVPCPSCLHPGLSRPADPEHGVVVYSHKDHPIDADGLPHRTNRRRDRLDWFDDLDDTLAFLASGATVVTSSYHGAYWATLLGRKVVLAGVFSSKFTRLRWPLPIAGPGGWAAEVADAPAYPHALDQARTVTRRFADDTRTLLQ